MGIGVFGCIKHEMNLIKNILLLTELVFFAIAVGTGTQSDRNITYCSSSSNITESEKGSECHNGHCEGVECVCDPGWSGDKCGNCSGSVLLENENGYIIEGVAKYEKGNECSWVVKPKKEGSYKIRLRINEFATECGWDYLYIFDGDSAFAPLLASFNGIVSSNNDDEGYRPEVVATSGTVFLHFFSDAEYTMVGFNITYSVNGCPQNCSGNGLCDDDGLCLCNSGWMGESCEARECNNECLLSPHTCYNENDNSLRDCVCPREFECPTNETSVGYWRIPNYLNATGGRGRSSHGAVLIGDSAWFYGGIQFDSSPFSNDLQVYNLTSETWELVSSGPTSPSLRYGHSMVVYGNGIYVFGGRDVLTTVALDELWMFDTNSSLWSRIDYVVDGGDDTSTNSSMLAVWGHTGTVVELSNGRTVMIVMFGFHTEFGLSRFVYEYDFEKETWGKVVVRGEIMQGTFSHTTTWDPASRLCYIHGGFRNVPTKTGITDSMASYQPDTKTFKSLKASGSPRLLHTATLTNGLLYMYGGCMHIDNTESSGALCFSPSFMAYHPAENEWKVLPESRLENNDMYGHVALPLPPQSADHGGEFLIFGGYNSRILDDLVLFKAFDCDAYSDNQTVCIDNPLQLTCEWNGTVCSSSSNVTDSSVQPASCDSDTNCSTCEDNEACNWCEGKCRNSSDCVKSEPCSEDVGRFCSAFQDCHQCQYNSECQWRDDKRCGLRTNNQSASCGEQCGMISTCDACVVKSSCMWCSNKRLCLATATYLIEFPYGECMEWLNTKASCPAGDLCSHHRTCASCMRDPYCGWCDSGQKNGLGSCYVGSLTGVQVPNPSLNVLTYGIESNSSCQSDRWHFTSCPICQCNGHSMCYNGTSECISCQNHTTGKQCEQCVPGYYGQALNGGTCQPCECFGRADFCDSVTGRCFCKTKGMTGDKCESCDSSSKYHGDPSKNGTCYYRLLMNFSFTFTLTDDLTDRYVTSINFENTPGEQLSTELNFNAQEYCDVVVTISKTHVEGETRIRNYTSVRSIQSLVIGVPGENGTFRIYVSNFTVPERIVISLVQRNNELLVLLLIIFSCFLVLLLITALLWKVKMFYDRYRQRIQRTEELQQMATRPFASILLSFEDVWSDEIEAAAKITNEELQMATEETTEFGGYAISTVPLQMPSCTQDKSSKPDHSGLFAFGTALLTNRKAREPPKAKEPKSQSKTIKILFKKGSRLRNSARRRGISAYAPSPAQGPQNPCAATSFTNHSASNNRGEGALSTSVVSFSSVNSDSTTTRRGSGLSQFDQDNGSAVYNAGLPATV